MSCGISMLPGHFKLWCVSPGLYPWIYAVSDFHQLPRRSHQFPSKYLCKWHNYLFILVASLTDPHRVKLANTLEKYPQWVVNWEKKWLVNLNAYNSRWATFCLFMFKCDKLSSDCIESIHKSIARKAGSLYRTRKFFVVRNLSCTSLLFTRALNNAAISGLGVIAYISIVLTKSKERPVM